MTSRLIGTAVVFLLLAAALWGLWEAVSYIPGWLRDWVALTLALGCGGWVLWIVASDIWSGFLGD